MILYTVGPCSSIDLLRRLHTKLPSLWLSVLEYAVL